MIVDYIDTHKQEYGIEPICRVLTAHRCKIAPSTYYDVCVRRRQPSKGQVRDEELKVEIARVHRENYSVYGARKVWLQCHREGIGLHGRTTDGRPRPRGSPPRQDQTHHDR
ncbi:hypothetical protein GCM10027068_13400 [Prescottella soli]